METNAWQSTYTKPFYQCITDRTVRVFVFGLMELQIADDDVS